MTNADTIRKIISSGETDVKIIAKKAKASSSQVYSILKKAAKQAAEDSARTSVDENTLEDEIHIDDVKFWSKTAGSHFELAYSHLKRSKRSKCFWGPFGALVVDDPKMKIKTVYKRSGEIIELDD